MEKIQSALAKARANRLARSRADSPVIDGQEVDQGSEPLASAAERLAARRLAVTKRWNDWPTRTFQPEIMERNRLVAFRGGAESTHFNVLRTRILQHMAENGWKRLAITSPGPSCGKTTLSLNLGFSLARIPDLRTIISEVDFRRPAMQKILGIDQDHSFANVMAGQEQIADNAFRFGSNLAITSCRSSIHSPAELLQGDMVPASLDRIQADYDPSIWVFDFPPMLVSDDALAFADRVDCILVLAGAENTTVKQLDRCERDLATRTNVLGIVLNKCRYLEREDTYDYSYEYK